jgi:hypothetical protein
MMAAQQMIHPGRPGFDQYTFFPGVWQEGTLFSSRHICTPWWMKAQRMPADEPPSTM